MEKGRGGVPTITSGKRTWREKEARGEKRGGFERSIPVVEDQKKINLVIY